jgi:hypothetical protein
MIAKQLAESKAESAKIQKSYNTNQKKWEKSVEDYKRRLSEGESRGAIVIVERDNYRRKYEDEAKGKEGAKARIKRALEATKPIDPATKGGSSM